MADAAMKKGKDEKKDAKKSKKDDSPSASHHRGHKAESTSAT